MKIISGDLFDYAHTGYIIHQVNCQNAMGSGFAKAFYEHYPEIKYAYHKEYDRLKRDGQPLLGHLQYVQLTPTLIGVNSFTQEQYGNARRTGIKYTNEDLLIENIVHVINTANTLGTNVYMPKYIGCGLAGGNWGTVMNALKGIDTSSLTIVGA